MSTKQKLIDEARRLIEAGSSRRAAAAAVGIPEATLRYHLNGQSRTSGRDRAEEVPYTRVSADEATIVAPPSKQVTDPRQLMIEMGLDPDEWDNPTVVVNRWGDPGDPSYQLKLNLKRKAPVEFVTPAVHIPPLNRSTKVRSLDDARVTVVLGDQQAPYHDPAAHALVCEALSDLDPDFVVLTGDTVDFPDISRHKDNPEWHVPAQACIDSGYRLLRDYVESCNAGFTKLLGNHDERIRNELLLRAERLYGIRPAPTAEQPEQADPLSIRNLLHLDELGIELIQPNGGYQHAQHTITSDIVVRHGWLTGANAPDKSLRNMDFSLIFGHTHRQSVTKRLVHDHTGRVREQIAVETGCLCRLEGGLGYAVDPNWAQGFAVASVWDDGAFNVELATIKNNGDNKLLMFREHQWSVVNAPASVFRHNWGADE